MLFLCVLILEGGSFHIIQLDIEIEQTDAMVQKKIETAVKWEKIESEVKAMNKEFFCDICDKQYKNVSEVCCCLRFVV